MRRCFSFVYTSFSTSCYVHACPFDPAYSASVCRGADQKCNKVFANVLTRMPAEILWSLCRASNSVLPLRVWPSSSFWQLHVRQDSWIFIRNSSIRETAFEVFFTIRCRIVKEVARKIVMRWFQFFSYLARNFLKRSTTNFEIRLFFRYQKFFLRKEKIANICQFIYTITSFLFSFFLYACKRHIGEEKINIRVRNIFSILNEEMYMWEYYISSCFTKREGIGNRVV